MTAHAPELNGYSEREAQLRRTIDRYAHLMFKEDKGMLRGNELDVLLLTGVRMREQARELGLAKRQLELMLEKTVQYLRRGTQAQRSS